MIAVLVAIAERKYQVVQSMLWIGNNVCQLDRPKDHLVSIMTFGMSLGIRYPNLEH